jgi:hypothetical protein
MMNALTIACQLNNDGVNMLMNGNSAEAVKPLQSALALMKQIANMSDEESEQDRPLQIKMPFRECEKDISDSFNNYCFVYNRPFILETVTRKAELEVLLPIYSSIIILNLAMTYHENGRRQSKSLRRASLLYKMCLQLLQSASFQSVGTVSLLLLVLNNRAQIFHDECDYVQSRNCFDALSKLMAKNQDITLILHESVIQGLLLNAMLLDAPTAARAA